jgi:hypothetical protein
VQSAELPELAATGATLPGANRPGFVPVMSDISHSAGGG